MTRWGSGISCTADDTVDIQSPDGIMTDSGYKTKFKPVLMTGAGLKYIIQANPNDWCRIRNRPIVVGLPTSDGAVDNSLASCSG